ncbi:MAG: leucine-rich repeat domain-containing protein [Patescibacteria group bacterium]|nr:leucine-rich repeat domain-containing protein [Patescibacteria group bacterium]
MKNILFLLLATGLLGASCSSSDLPIASTENTPRVSGNQEQVTFDEENVSETNVLDLSNQGLTKIPDYVFSMTNLVELDVSGNNLTGAIQAEIRNLSNLKYLIASDNMMTGVPAEIGQLSNLEILDLSNNNLTGLPYELGNLQNLKTFVISGNDYSEQDLKIIMDKMPGGVQLVD